MKVITLLAIGVIYLLSVCFALSRGYDVKAAFKIPFVAFTFEADGSKKTELERKRVAVTSTVSDDSIHPSEVSK